MVPSSNYIGGTLPLAFGLYQPSPASGSPMPQDWPQFAGQISIRVPGAPFSYFVAVCYLCTILLFSWKSVSGTEGECPRLRLTVLEAVLCFLFIHKILRICSCYSKKIHFWLIVKSGSFFFWKLCIVDFHSNIVKNLFCTISRSLCLDV